jgi:hypothetical protein
MFYIKVLTSDRFFNKILVKVAMFFHSELGKEGAVVDLRNHTLFP